MKSWTDEFASYRFAISEHRIREWLEQFKGHQELAARVLDAVDFYSPGRISGFFRQALELIPGWSPDASKRSGKWRFVAFTGSAGQSGDTMLHQFRLANGIDRKKYDELFIYRSDLLRANLGSEDTLVFVDDLTATGNQVCETWLEQFAELVPEIGRVYLLVVVASDRARTRIAAETELSLVAGHTLSDCDNIFADNCPHFSETERNALLTHSRRASREKPKGWGDCGYCVVFAHRCPNNSIPLLHANHEKWTGLFLRNE